MRRAVLLLFTATIFGAMAPSAAAPTPPESSAPPCLTSAKASHAFIDAVWSRAHWRRRKVPAAGLRAWRHKLSCAGPANRLAMKRRWRKARRAFHAYQDYRRRWGNCTDAGPVPDCIHGAALTYGADESWMRAVSWCESHWDRFAVNPSGSTGLFQFMRSTWAKTPFGSKSIWSAKWQSLAAAWMESRGARSAWVCQG